MKSALITNKNKQDSYSYILDLLLKSLKCELTVISCSPSELRNTVKKALRGYDTVIISGDFLNNKALDVLHRDILKNAETFSDESGKVIGEYTVFKETTIAVIPLEPEQAEKFIYTNFNSVGISYGFQHFLTATINVASKDIRNIEQTISELLTTENPTVTVKQNKLYSEVTVTAFGNSKAATKELLDNTVSKISLLLGDDLFSLNNPHIEKIVVDLLLKNNLKIATAESCTGGLMSEMITAVPNSSAVFEIGITSYSNRIKQYALSVPKDTLTNFGAVSKQTAAAMAAGVKNLSGADFGIGITGVAGPSSSEGKPVGTVYIALCDGKYYWVRKLSLSPFSSREEVRQAACFTAFDLARRYIECKPAILPEYSIDADNINCLYEQPHFINSSLLFMRSNLSEYLKQEETRENSVEEFITGAPFADGTTSSASLEKLRKKVLKEHRVKFRFKMPDVKAVFKDFLNRLYTTTDLKGFLLTYFYKAATLILISSVIMVSVLAIDIFTKDIQNTRSIEKARSLWTNSNALTSNGIYQDFEEIHKLNPQIHGWISINNTAINNPICGYRSDNYYQNHNYLNKLSEYGSLYFASDTNESNQNTIIYGNNPNDGSMFADLIKYRDTNFAKESQIIEFSTLNNKGKYQIFAVITATSNPAHDTENAYFDYERTSFVDESDFNMWLSEARLRSLYDCSLPVTYGDHLLTLVTDSGDFSSAKLIVIARKVDDESSISEFPLKVNSAPRFPAVWYKLHNLENPYNFLPDIISGNY